MWNCSLPRLGNLPDSSRQRAWTTGMPAGMGIGGVGQIHTISQTVQRGEVRQETLHLAQGRLTRASSMGRAAWQDRNRRGPCLCYRALQDKEPALSRQGRQFQGGPAGAAVPPQGSGPEPPEQRGSGLAPRTMRTEGQQETFDQSVPEAVHQLPTPSSQHYE